MNLQKLNRILLQTLLLPIFALLLVSAVLVWQILAAESTVNAIQLTDHNIASATRISTLLTDEEAGLRGFQATSNAIFLQPYLFSVVPMREGLDTLRAGLAQQDEGMTLGVDELSEAHRVWLSTVAEPLIRTIRVGGNTRDPGLNLRGKAQRDHLRDLVNRIIDNQKVRRAEDVSRWQAAVRHSLEGVVGLSLFVGLLIGAYTRSRLHAVSSAFQGTLTALRRSAETASASEARLRTTLTSMSEGVMVCDEGGRIALLNQTAEGLTGWRSEDALGHLQSEVLRLVREADGTGVCLPLALEPGLHHGATAPPMVLLRRDGTELQVEASSTRTLDRGAGGVGSVVVFRDVSEQRRTQAALLSSEKLAVAGRLAATLAHEIHNPLDSVMNLLYLLKEGSTAEESAQYLDLARAELDRVAQISRAMLGMYRESRFPIPLDVRSMLENVLLLLEPQMTQAGLTLETEYETPGEIVGYPAELRQVFTNLLTNAMDASPAGGTVRVGLKRGPGRAGTPGVVLEVQDRGGGIPPETLSHLFQPFFTTKGEKGTGLGLWVSQGIIDRHKGEIQVQSSTDSPHGTTFCVWLPAPGDTHAAAAAPQDSAAQQSRVV